MENEKRLIDANALKDEILSWAVCINKPHLLSKDDTLCVIDTAPTVDGVEVVHGQWDTVFYERNGTLASYSHICQKCKYFYRDLRFKGHNYCPNCGAKMMGDTE